MENKNIGAFWRKQNGERVYYTGSIEINGEKVAIILFKNDRFKEGEKFPYFHAYPVRERNQE